MRGAGLGGRVRKVRHLQTPMMAPHHHQVTNTPTRPMATTCPWLSIETRLTNDQRAHEAQRRHQSDLGFCAGPWGRRPADERRQYESLDQPRDKADAKLAGAWASVLRRPEPRFSALGRPIGIVFTRNWHLTRLGS